MTVRVELYGRLRDAGLGAAVELELAGPATAKELLASVAARLADPKALAGAVVATETDVLAPEARLPEGGRLAVLPPVCGG